MTGILYPLLTGWMKAPAALRGMAFGTLIWAASNIGWLPAVNLMPRATKMPARRSLLMVASHWVWGALTELMIDQME